MGRHYWGDIGGKFWFAVQPSTDANFFGVEGHTPNYLEYRFDDVEPVNKGIKKVMDELGYTMKGKLDGFFMNCHTYTPDDIAVCLGVSLVQAQRYLELYARLRLGIKIRDCIVGHGSCSFDAEL